MFLTNLRNYQQQLNNSFAHVNGYSRVATSPTLAPANLHILSGLEGDGWCSTDERLDRHAPSRKFTDDQIRESADLVLAIPSLGDFECTSSIGQISCHYRPNQENLEPKRMSNLGILLKKQAFYWLGTNICGFARLPYKDLDKEVSPPVT